MNPWEYDPLRAEEDIAKLRKANENALTQIEGLKTELESSRNWCKIYFDQKNTAQSELAAAKRDAERYQYTRWNHETTQHGIALDEATDKLIERDRVDFDAARTPSAARGGEKP